jgi:hypothetical protein
MSNLAKPEGAAAEFLRNAVIVLICLLILSFALLVEGSCNENGFLQRLVNQKEYTYIK